MFYEQQAQELFDRLMEQRAVCEGITEDLKASDQMDWQNECPSFCGYGNCQCGGDLRMRVKKYYLYLTDAERRLVLKALIALRNKLIVQSRYTDIVDEVIIKLYK